MDLETIKNVGLGGGGGIIGVILAFLGFKSRLDSIDDKLKNVVFEDTCHARVAGMENQMKTQTDLMKEQRDDIKELLKKQ